MGRKNQFLHWWKVEDVCLAWWQVTDPSMEVLADCCDAYRWNSDESLDLLTILDGGLILRANRVEGWLWGRMKIKCMNITDHHSRQLAFRWHDDWVLFSGRVGFWILPPTRTMPYGSRKEFRLARWDAVGTDNFFLRHLITFLWQRP